MAEPDLSPVAARIVSFFNALRADTMDLCDGFYHPDVEFVDPLCRIEGREALKRYYAGMYESVREIRFDFDDFVTQGPTTVASWSMHLVARVNSGKPFAVPGVSWIRFDDQLAVYHRDVFDVGAFVYERVPVLGWLTRKVKRRLAAH